MDTSLETSLPLSPEAVEPANPPVSPESPCANLDVTEKARCLLVQHHQDVKKRDQSLLTRLADDVGMDLAEAGHFSNHIQGKMAAGSSGYDRSHAAMS